MKRCIALVIVLVVGLCAVADAQNRTYTIEDLMKVRRVGDPQISPDGKTVAFTVAVAVHHPNLAAGRERDLFSVG